MKPLNQYDEKGIISKELLDEIFEEEDETERSFIIAECALRAKELKVSSVFRERVNSYKRMEREIAKESTRNTRQRNDNITDFPVPLDGNYENMRCGQWCADSSGIVSYSVIGMEQRACYHPLLPVRRLSNVETNEEKITLAFRRDYKWKEITVDKDVISSATKIISLAKYGINVTSESAKYLVKYLSDVENMNCDEIELKNSTSKLGWHGADFLPYESDLVFDGESKFKELYESIHEFGDSDIWMEHVKELRKTNRTEIKFMLASSFASVLVQPIGALPFFVDLWGETEGGKSVSLMLSASVWANPDGNKYIGDYKSTDVALEVRADMLNNLPVLLDDTSNATKRIVEDFENIIYRLCSGKGKSRSNKELGTNRENSWKTCFLTNGEKPLSGYVNQGGAINRILEVECGSNIYKNPQITANILKANYGFAGKMFIEAIKEIGFDEIKKQYTSICSDIMRQDKMQKQAMSLALVLLADRIAENAIFHDGVNISMEEANSVLIDRTELSENERCYHYLLDTIAMNRFRFEGDTNTEHWGILEDGYAILYPTVFEKLCNNAGYSAKAFKNWAKDKDIILFDKNGQLKQKRFVTKNIRAVWLKLEVESASNTDGFSVSEDLEDVPFK